MICQFLDNGQEPKYYFDIPLLKTALQKTTTARNKIGSDYNVLSDQIVDIYNRLLELNVTTTEIHELLIQNIVNDD